MDASKFKDTVAVDQEYEAPEQDPECLLVHNYPFCANGKYTPENPVTEPINDDPRGGESRPVMCT